MSENSVRYRICVFAVGAVLPFFCCAAGETNPSDFDLFERSVRPILIEHCYECHAGNASKGGLRLDTREGTRRGGDSGPTLVPGEANASRLIEAVRYNNETLQMPPKGKLSAADIAALEKWVEQGAPDPRVEGSPTAVAPTGMSIEEGREFWSFKPLAIAEIPSTDDASWVSTPVDAFILSKLHSRGMQPAARADKRTLIRRATLDLTGLPPTPKEISDFLADESDEAFSKVIERLLRSSEYGVRWGRHWLDVARYADSNGLDENLAFGHAWRYRDYVVDSFNHDKPFNRFVIEQLAGDLLDDANPETRTATGFLALGAKVLAEPDKSKLEMDTIDEQLDTMGKAFLGLTLGCARCHDHKFDPIKQRDYYSLAAIFKGTRTFGDTTTGVIKHWYEHSFASSEELEGLKPVDASIAEKKRLASAFRESAMNRIREEARSKAGAYLAVSSLFEPDASLAVVSELAEKHGVHPYILFHCRRHLQFHSDDPLFAKWRELAPNREFGAIESYYRELFAAAMAAPKVEEVASSGGVTSGAAAPESVSTTEPVSPLLPLAKAALLDLSGFLAVPPKPEFAFDSTTLAEYHRLAEESRLEESVAQDSSAAMGVSEGTPCAELPIHIRGSHLNLGEPVAREFPEVLRSPEREPSFPSDKSGRLELAKWMVEDARHVVARIYVNRIWRWHFAHGMVGTTENIGRLGERPTHPELLDWLANRFIESGWSTKELHRLIMNSSVYQTESKHAKEAVNATIDAENRLLWKYPTKRLEAEAIRDSILEVAGRLDHSIGGKTVPLRNKQFVFDHTSIDHTKYDSLRRAIYLPVVRNNLYTLFEQFDFPDPTMPTGSRNETLIAPQALLLLNFPLVLDSAEEWAKRLLMEPVDDEGRIRMAYEVALGRAPTEREIERGKSFLREVSNTMDGKGEIQAWSLFCQSLYASNEFLYVR